MEKDFLKLNQRKYNTLNKNNITQLRILTKKGSFLAYLTGLLLNI